MGTLLNKVEHIKGKGLVGFTKLNEKVPLIVPAPNFLIVNVEEIDNLHDLKKRADYLRSMEEEEKAQFVKAIPDNWYVCFSSRRYADDGAKIFFIPYNSYTKRD